MLDIDYNMTLLKFLIISAVLFYFPIHSNAVGDYFTPWSFSKGNPSRSILTDNHKEEGELSPAAVALVSCLNFFRNYISAVDGDRCQMNPSCSAYALESIKKHGFMKGYLMTVDRLLHESNEMEIAPLIRVGPQWRYHDPVENNDFWWSGSKAVDK